MDSMQPPSSSAPRRIDPVGKLMFVLISLTVVGLGALAVMTGYVPERATRYGIAGALFDSDAMRFGVTLILFGFSPLAIFAKTSRIAGLWAGGCVILALLTLFFGSKFLA